MEHEIPPGNKCTGSHTLTGQFHRPRFQDLDKPPFSACDFQWGFCRTFPGLGIPISFCSQLPCAFFFFSLASPSWEEPGAFGSSLRKTDNWDIRQKKARTVHLVIQFVSFWIPGGRNFCRLKKIHQNRRFFRPFCRNILLHFRTSDILDILIQTSCNPPNYQ